MSNRALMAGFLCFLCLAAGAAYGETVWQGGSTPTTWDGGASSWTAGIPQAGSGITAATFSGSTNATLTGTHNFGSQTTAFAATFSTSGPLAVSTSGYIYVDSFTVTQPYSYSVSAPNTPMLTNGSYVGTVNASVVPGGSMKVQTTGGNLTTYYNYAVSGGGTFAISAAGKVLSDSVTLSNNSTLAYMSGGWSQSYVNGGTISGNGTIDNSAVNANGYRYFWIGYDGSNDHQTTMSPGASAGAAGIINFNGTQGDATKTGSADSRLLIRTGDCKMVIDITGTGSTAGVNFDQIHLNNFQVLAGDIANTDLVINVAAGSAATNAPIMLSTGTGTGIVDFSGMGFRSVTWNGTAGTLSYVNGAINATVTPEPATLAVLAAGGLVCLRRRNRA